MSDEFAETDIWPGPDGWAWHQAETGLTPPTQYAGSSKVAATYHPDTTGTVWRDRGAIIATQQARIAQLEAEVEQLKRDVAGQTRSAQNGWRNADAFRLRIRELEAQVKP